MTTCSRCSGRSSQKRTAALRRSWFTVPVLGLALILANCAPGAASGQGSAQPDNGPDTSASGVGTTIAPSGVPVSSSLSVPPLMPVPVPSAESHSPPAADRLTDVIAHGSRERPLVALTFDADMSPSMLQRLRDGSVRSWYDARIIAELRETRTPATIFATGLWAIEYADELREIAADPLFEIENHSMTHAAFDSPCYTLDVLTSPDDKRREVVDTAQILAETTGRAPQFFRFPGGCYAPDDVSLVQQAGELPVGWDVVSGDPFQQDPAVVVRNVLDNVRPGSIVVLHLNGAPNAPATAVALRQIIPGLQARGLQAVTLEQLLAAG